MTQSGVILLAGFAATTIAMTAASQTAAVGDRAVVEVETFSVTYVEQALVASERNGVVAVVDLREGDSVRARQRLIQLKDELQRAQVATLTRQADSPESDAKIEDARLANQFAIERYNIAVEAKRTNRDSVSRAELLEQKAAADRSATKIEEARLDLEVTKLKKQEAEAELRMCAILAPIDGFVTRVLKHPGEAVQLGDPVAEVVNPRKLKVEGYVTAGDAQRLKPGMKATASPHVVPNTGNATPVSATGVLVFVDVGVEPVSQRVRVWAEIDNRELKLRPGLLARLTIDTTPPAEREPAR
ncbi:MAG: HlyD family efflux transporter periplasmic adaptor subunit [Planctomycetaceae bacterium]|nr:HlyD family efflux transporter periplasmic adaptor subunit [Planctomycetaceae bacterium]